MLDYRIITFLKVCQTLNFTHAAQILHITQPAVSQHIRFLEEKLHAKLFKYEGKQLVLTETGKILYRFAATVNHDFHELTNQIVTESNKIKLHFGVTLTIGEYLMPQVLVKLLNRHKNIQLQMIVANTAELLTQMEEEKLDFAIVEGYYPNQEYEGKVYRLEPFIGVCHPHHTYANKPCTLDDIKNECLLLREKGSGTREVLERTLKEKNISFEDFSKRIEIGNLNVIKHLVKEKIGITFCYEPVVSQELKQGELKMIPLTDFQVIHEFKFIWRKNSLYQNLYQNIFDLMCECIE